MAETEEYFPRGGKKPTVTYFKQSGNFLGAAEKGERKKKKLKKKSEGDDGYLSDEATKEVDQSFKNCAYGLTYKTAKPGLLILGRVKQVQETKVIVSLPCRMQGSVMACHISEPYNKLLEAYVNDQTDKVLDLWQMFRPGQYVAVKVLEVEAQSLLLTCMPHHVNSGKSFTDLHKGALLQAAVASVEDHGFVMDIGIPNTRAFLPKTNANPDIELDVGMLTWCSVKSASEGSVVTLTSELATLQQAFTRHNNKSPLLPATALDFTVDTPLDNGIEGHVFGDMTSYIQRQHADTVKGKKPALGQKIRGRVLYVMPTRNTPFLSMKNIFETTYPDLEEEQKLKDGDVIDDAQVLKITGRSIHFKLGKGSFGTMSLKRIQVHEDLTDEEVVAKSYPVGSTHKVRVLCYNLSDFAYSVTDQPGVVNERYFSVAQLAPGDVVPATVKLVADSHLLLTIGRVTGFVPHAHISDGGIYLDPKKARTSKLTKKKFKVGQEVKARVMCVEAAKEAVTLTLKPSLLAPGLEVLASYQQAEVGKGYTGVIKYIKDYILVTFFNNVTAYIPRGYVTKEPIDNLSDAFHLGQIVNCTILKVDPENKKMSGSLTTVPFWPNKKRESEKRKHKSDETEEVPNKKHKNNDDQTDTEKKKDKNKKKQKSQESIEEPVKSKKKTKVTEEVKVSEESDAIETDIHEDSDQILTPIDMGLIDFSDCTTPKQYKKRVVSLIKAIKARTRRMDTIDKKIANIEEDGLTARNKKFHTAMHSEKLVIEERIKKLLEALKIGQEKLKELGIEDKEDYKAKQKELKLKKKLEKAKGVSEVKEEKIVKEKKEKIKDIKVVESLEPALDVPSAKDFWSANADSLAKTVQEEESSSSEDEEKDQPKKKRKKLTVAEKLSKARDEEERVREMERRAIESESQPRSSEQFERALLANPSCSQLWIAYMAFHLQATEIEKARAVGRKALGTISFREEHDKLNVWLAMLNFENRFGNKESQQKTLEEALQMNDTFKVHSKLLDIYVETGKHQELATLVDLMIRKYKRDPNMYILCGGACFKLGLVDKARHVMQKAIAVLEKKEHVSVLVQFALLERSNGAPERAEALFEQVLAVYPQRVDVCAVYIDMLMKTGDVEHVRQVMERMTSQKLPARKMKVLYKKWIEVEEKIGNQDEADRIRQRAMEFIEKAKF